MKLESLTLGEIVSANYKSAIIFEKHHLDFCCQGNRTLQQACNTAQLDVNTIIEELTAIPSDESATDFAQWSLDTLSDYIFKRHHQYIEQVTPVIKNLLDKICVVHGEHHKELYDIKDIFNKTSGELAVHMKKEELILFPFIKKLVQNAQQNKTHQSPLFTSVLDPIDKMESDHLEEGEQLMRMRTLSNNFTPPPDACFSFTTAYKMLEEYETDMHMHIHLENNILFPAAIKLESELSHSTNNIL